MADYNYMKGGSIINGKGRLAGIHNNTYSVVEEERSKPGYVTKTDIHRDHVCRPVFVDADGKTRPAVMVLPSHQRSDGFVSKTETLVEERVYTSPATNHTHGSAAKVEPVKDYAAADRVWGKARNHFPDQSTSINEFITSAHPGMRSSSKGLPGGMYQRWHKPSDGPNDIGTNRWSRPNGGTIDIGNDGWNRPMDGTNNTVNNGFSRPYGGTNDTRRHKSSEIGTEGCHTPIGGTSDIHVNGWSKLTDTEGWNKPIGGTNDIHTNGWSKSTGNGGWNKPIAGTTDIQTHGWSKKSGNPVQQPIHEAPISRATNDIGPAVDFVKESTRPHSVSTATQQGRFPPSLPTTPVKESVIDSKEAARKYGGISAAKKEPARGPAIDSREAAKKYHGTFV